MKFEGTIVREAASRTVQALLVAPEVIINFLASGILQFLFALPTAMASIDLAFYNVRDFEVRFWLKFLAISTFSFHGATSAWVPKHPFNPFWIKDKTQPPVKLHHLGISKKRNVANVRLPQFFDNELHEAFA